MYDIIIVGAGPAGMTAALYALRANKKVLILEANTYGGRIITANKIDNYPGIAHISGFEFANNLYQQIEELGVEMKFETVLRVDEEKKVTTDKNTYQSKAIILATGSENRKLNLEREQEFVGKGVSYCATCDGNFYKNKVVAVTGGGDTAFEDAIYLADIAKKVYLIHRSEHFKAENNYVEECKKKENVEFLLNSTITSLNGNEKLESVTINNEKTLEIDGLFIAVGQTPKNQIFANVVELNEQGYILSEDGVHTKVKGIYVAGDTRVKSLRQLTTAVSDGSIAATTAIREME